MVELLELVVWSGRIAGILFILNFVTCFAMPWAQKCMRNSKQDHAVCHEESFPLCRYHKPIAWLTLFFVLVHITLALWAV